MPRHLLRFRCIGEALAATAVTAFVLATATPAAAAERRPVPNVTIYPGDIIRDAMLTDADFPNAVGSSSFASSRSMLVGKAARRTLLPGQPVPTNAIGEPKIVTIGAMVRVVFEEDGLTISTYASALQAGAAGDFISVRNMDSGITVGGVIRADGSIHVGAS